MSRSVLLQLARDSIEEVLQAQSTIDKASLLHQHPLLEQKISLSIKLFLDDELRGSCATKGEPNSLLYEIIINAKKAAFEDNNFTPITTSQYLACEIELTINAPDGTMSEKDKSILSSSTNQVFQEK